VQQHTIQGALATAGFRSMPFRIVPPTEMENVQWAGDRSTIDALYEAAQAPRDDFLSTSELVVLFGEFGSGKTNALKWLTNRMRTDGQLVAYLVKPSVADKPLWHDVVRSLFTQAFSKADIISRLTPVRKHVLVESKRRAREALGATADEDPDALRVLESEKKREIAAEIVPEHPGFVDFVVDLCDSSSGAVQNRNWAYMADKPSTADGKAIANLYGLPAEGIGSDWSATLLLSSLIQGVTHRTPYGIGSEVVCILMDEVEDLNDLASSARLSILQGLRDLFNACTEHLYIALAASASDASEMWGILDAPLMQRLSRQPVQFPQLEPDQARDFMLEVMALNRRADFGGAPEWPFSTDGLDAFVHGCPPPLTPRKLLVSAQRLVFQQQLAKVASEQPIDASDVAEFTSWGAG
jgi:hypothetical protein